VARFRCDCGEAINMGPMPNPDGVSLISDADLRSVGDRVVDAHNLGVSDYEMLRALKAGADGSVRDQPFRQAYICPNCSRLHLMHPNEGLIMTKWVFESGDRHPFQPPRDAAELKGVWRMPRTEETASIPATQLKKWAADVAEASDEHRGELGNDSPS